MKWNPIFSRCCGIFILLHSISWVNAQVLNTDKTSALDSTKKTQSVISVSIATDQQKKNLVDLFYSGDFTFVGKKNATTLYTKIDRVTNGGQSIQDIGTFQLKNNRSIGHQLYLESFIQYQWDGGLGLEGRSLAGLNLVHYFKNTQNEDFFWGAGLFLEKEKWNWSAVNDDSKINNEKIEITHAKLNITAKYSIIHPNNNFEIIIRAFNQTGKIDNQWGNRTSLFSTIQLPISKKLSTSFNIDFLYDTHPIVPIGNFHYNYYQTLAFSF
ncbi:MAG: hypothetical protein WCP61_05465 [Chitinophagia bacterium]|jgi:hypothetical protein